MKKYYLLIIILILLITTTIVTYVQAENPDKSLDTDNDGLTDWQEKAIYQTFWADPDTDKDGYNDGTEVASGYSPKQKNLKMFQADTDNDGLNDKWEILLGSNLMLRDTDRDGFLDGTEVYNDFSPTDPRPIKVKKRIEVSIKDLKLDFYVNNILLETFPVSTGKTSTPTPVGDFKILAKIPSKNYNIYPNTKWNLHFTTQNGLRYYIHGAYWHNKFGQETVSGGCVNVRYEDMERLYNFTSIGTEVIVQ